MLEDILEFVSLIQGDDVETIYRIPKGAQGPGYETVRFEELPGLVGETDVYFIPCIGGTKNEQIYLMPCCFIDLDAGRNPDKSYKLIDEVEGYKKKKLQEIRDFIIQPTAIVETRNGYQMYWVLKTPICDKRIWKELTLRLIEKFQSDDRVNFECHLMRLPYTIWRKPVEGLEPFEISVTELNPDLKTTPEELLMALEDVVVPDRKKSRMESKSLSTGFVETNNKMIDAIRTGDIGYLQSILEPEPEVFDNYGDFYRYITQEIDLAALLGIRAGEHQCCFHNDRSPSASLFRSKLRQHFYKCHSSSCGFIGNIRGCIEHIRGCSSVDAIEFIKKVYRLEIVESAWQKRQKAILEECKNFIIHELEALYPEVYDNVKRDLALLYIIIDEATKHVHAEHYQDRDGNPIFFTSLRKIGRIANISDPKSVCKKIANLVFHKLLQKKDESAIPVELVEKARCHARAKNHEFLVSYYAIPSYASNHLIECRTRARMFDHRPLVHDARTREGYLRTYGEEVADEVYPQTKGKQNTQASDERTLEIQTIVMDAIEERGWISEREIVEKMRKFYNKTLSKAQVKRSIGEVLDSYGLVMVKLTKALKERLMVESIGYGANIIILI